MQVTTIGLDLAKNVFQVHGVDAEGEIVVRKKVRRVDVLAFFAALPPCGKPSARPSIDLGLMARG